MNESTPLVQFPVPSTLTLVMLGLGFAALLFAAVAYEIYRRVNLVRERRAAEWRHVHEILNEREVTPESRAVLERLIKRHGSATPLRVVTTRDGFEHCVEAEMAALHSKKDPSAVEESGQRLRDIRVDLGLDYIPVGQRIHSTRELHEGQWLSMAPEEEDKPQWFRVMLEDLNEAYFYVVLKDAPSSAAPRIDPGARVRCRLWREEDARYLFNTEVAAYDEPPATWRLHHTKDLRRTQARRHFRVRHDQPVTVGVINAPADGNKDDVRHRRIVTRLRGRVTSLSAGGCAVVLKQAVARQVMLRLAIELPDGQTLETEAEIVASSAISGGRYLLRLQFVGLSDEERDHIARYVLQKQQMRLAEHGQSG